MFTDKQITELEAPLLKEHVSSRKNYGGGSVLSYIEQWHAIMEANRIFGFGNWDRETTQLRLLDTRKYEKDKTPMTSVAYMAQCRITVRSAEVEDQVVREGCGFGTGQSKNCEDAHELAIKEAESDAMKRAFMTFGNQFGLALYDKTRVNVASNKATVKEAKQDGLYEKLLEDMHSQRKVDHLEAWWVRNKEERAKLPKGWANNLKEAAAEHKKTIMQLESSEHRLGD